MVDAADPDAVERGGDLTADLHQPAEGIAGTDHPLGPGASARDQRSGREGVGGALVRSYPEARRVGAGELGVSPAGRDLAVALVELGHHVLFQVVAKGRGPDLALLRERVRAPPRDSAEPERSAEGLADGHAGAEIVVLTGPSDGTQSSRQQTHVLPEDPVFLVATGPEADTELSVMGRLGVVLRLLLLFRPAARSRMTRAWGAAASSRSTRASLARR